MQERVQKKDRSGYLFDNRALVALIIPLIIEQTLAVLVGMADSIMVASVGEAAVSGVSLVDNIMVLLINVFSALATGGAVVAGQYLGQGRKEGAGKAADQLVWFITICAVGITLLIYACRHWILHGVFGQIDADVMGHANTYLLIVTASIPFIALYNGGAAIFRTMGNSKISMRVAIVMNIINVTGNAILIYGVKMGTAGVAIPTLVSRIVAAVLIMVLLCDSRREISVTRSLRYRPDFSLIRKILSVGVPNGLENSMFQLGKIIVLSLVSTFGTYAIAANAVSNTLASFQVLPGMAIALAVTTVIARCVGAGDYPYYPRSVDRYESYHCRGAASDPEDLQSVRHYGRDDVADRNLLRGLLGAVLAFVLYAAGHLPCLRRRPDVHDHFRGIHVDLPGDFQLCAGQIPGHGSVWRLGGHDHRLAGTGILFCAPVPQRKMEAPCHFLRNDARMRAGKWKIALSIWFSYFIME